MKTIKGQWGRKKVNTNNYNVRSFTIQFPLLYCSMHIKLLCFNAQLKTTEMNLMK